MGGVDGAQRLLLAAVVVAQDVVRAHRVVLQVVALGELGDPRIRQQLAHPFDVQIDLDGQRYAFRQAAPHRVADRQVHVRVQVIDAVLELQVGGADLESALETIGLQRPHPQQGDAHGERRAHQPHLRDTPWCPRPRTGTAWI